MKIVEFLHKNGLFGTLLIVFNMVEGLLFDARYKTDTCRRVLLSDLHIEALSKSFGTKYDPSPISALRRLLSSIQIPKDSNFVDFGSGKGRVLLIASQFKFNNVIGVEFSSALCDVAKNNVNKYLMATSVSCNSITILNDDAQNYTVADDDCVLFFFNPFGPEIMSLVIGNIIKSYEKNRRDIYMIYYNPVHENLFADFHSIELVEVARTFGRFFNIYMIKS